MIQCECGGALKLQSQSYGEDTAFESYECASCGETGTYTFGDCQDRVSGCVVIE